MKTYGYLKLPAIALTSTLLCSGILLANDPFKHIHQSGEYEIKAGTYNADTSTAPTDAAILVGGKGTDITVNVVDGDTVTLHVTTPLPNKILDAYGDSSPSTPGGKVEWNGNLNLYVTAANTSLFTPIWAVHGGGGVQSSLTINGDLKLETSNSFDRAGGRVWSLLVMAEEGASISLNGKVDLSGTSTNTSSTGTALSAGVATDVWDRATDISLGTNTLDPLDIAVRIHGIESYAARTSEAYGIYAESSPASYTINVKGNTVIENISATSGSPGFTARAAGVASGIEKYGWEGYGKGTIDFQSNLTIRDIVATGPSQAMAYGIYANSVDGNSIVNAHGKTVIENIVASGASGFASGAFAEFGGIINFNNDLTISNISAPSEAYALTVWDGGTINVNVDTNNNVKIDGDLQAWDSGSNIYVELTNASSYLRGAVSEGDGGKVNLSLTDGGTWYVTAHSTINELYINGGVVDVARTASIYYDNTLDLASSSEASTLAFHADTETNVGQIILGTNADVTVGALGAQVKVTLGGLFADDSIEYSILLINTSGSGVTLNAGDFNATFVWSGGSGAVYDGWYLFADSSGLYARYDAIPEPSTWLLLGAGVAVVIVFRRRRKNQ